MMCFPSLFTPQRFAFSSTAKNDSQSSTRRFATTASSRSHFNETTKTWEVSKEDAKRGNPRSQQRLKPDNGRRGSRNTEVLIFPDAQMPCRSIVDNYQCKKSDCRYSHDAESNLVRFLRALDSAKETLDIVCFTITCDEIKRVIQRVAQRGVRVRIVSDANNVDSLGSDIRELSEARKIDVRCDAHSNDPNKRGMMHHKFAVIDGGKTVITGSFNWTRAGVLDNHDNVLIARNMPEVAEPYVEHMNQLWEEYAAFQIHGTDG